MNTTILKAAVSVIALVVVVLHLFVPSISVDAVTVTLLIAAAIPWLSSIFRTIELPGGWKVEFQDLSRVTERAKEVGLLSADSDQTYSFEIVAEQDPNLALAGLRIELEKNLRSLLGPSGVTRPVGIKGLVRELEINSVISREQESLLLDLVPLLNKAVHGAKVDPSGSEWAITTGRQILSALSSKQ